MWQQSVLVKTLLIASYLFRTRIVNPVKALKLLLLPLEFYNITKMVIELKKIQEFDVIQVLFKTSSIFQRFD